MESSGRKKVGDGTQFRAGRCAKEMAKVDEEGSEARTDEDAITTKLVADQSHHSVFGYITGCARERECDGILCVLPRIHRRFALATSHETICACDFRRRKHLRQGKPDNKRDEER